MVGELIVPPFLSPFCWKSISFSPVVLWWGMQSPGLAGGPDGAEVGNKLESKWKSLFYSQGTHAMTCLGDILGCYI